MIKRLAARSLRALGYDVQKVRARRDLRPPQATEDPWTDLSFHAERTATIPGMTSEESCKMLYALCYQQTDKGDVAEIGSWQGKSTAFLGQAVKDSGNGVLYAIDHFKGNVGKTAHYVVGQEDLSDLEAGFRSNMERMGLTDTVELLNMPAGEAAEALEDKSLRFLFIDGDHTLEGVTADVETFWPKLKPGAILVFDDYSINFPGVVEVARKLHHGLRAERTFAYWNTFVITLPRGRLPKRPPL